MYILIASVQSALIFYDDFNSLNTTRWKHDITLSGGGNWEFQLYDSNRSTCFAKDGVLHIKPRLTSERIGEDKLRNGYRMDFWGGTDGDRCTGARFYGCERMSDGLHIINPVSSALLKTAETFRYGRFQIRAKLPVGDWLWPAIWLLPKHNNYGEWPSSGQIDIMQSRGNKNYPKQFGGGTNSFASTLHWGTDFFSNRFNMTHNQYDHPTPLSDDFHTYGLYWDSTKLYTYIDNDTNKVLTLDFNQTMFEKGKFGELYNPWADGNINAPFDQEYYIILNLAAGGTNGYFQEGVAGKPWSNVGQSASRDFFEARGAWLPTWTQDFMIDWVKVWSIDTTKDQDTLSRALTGLMRSNGLQLDPMMITNCIDNATATKIAVWLGQIITNSTKYTATDYAALSTTVTNFIKGLPDTLKTCFSSNMMYKRLLKAYNATTLNDVATKYNSWVGSHYALAHTMSTQLDPLFKAGKFQEVGEMLSGIAWQFISGGQTSTQ